MPPKRSRSRSPSLRIWSRSAHKLTAADFKERETGNPNRRLPADFRKLRTKRDVLAFQRLKRKWLLRRKGKNVESDSKIRELSHRIRMINMQLKLWKAELLEEDYFPRPNF